MRRLIFVLLGLAVAGLAVFWFVTMPHPRSMDPYAVLSGDKVHGQEVFWASGCASCHMAPKAEGDAQMVLAGGQSFATQFGTFLAPNISTDKTHGIGNWTLDQFVHAVQDGISPAGQHYFPAMPYVAYAKMAPQDVVDLKAFMDTLPASETPSQPHQVSFPFNIRRSLGGWKLLFASEAWVLPDAATPMVQRGRYIAEAMAHCGECHTPRNLLGGLNRSRWLAGAPLPDGPGKVPNITPGKLTWSDNDIFTYLTTGFTPEFDSAGGSMSHVVQNMAKLPETDVRAVIAYLKAIPAVP